MSRKNAAMLIEKITRNKILECKYWKTHCLYLNAKTLIDKAVELRSFGGAFSAFHHPTPFMCLLMKLLQLQPDEEIITMFLTNPHYRYLRILGAFYVRLTKKPVHVYQLLEPLLVDYRKMKRLIEGSEEYTVVHMDECIDELLREDSFCGLTLPSMVSRLVLENSGLIEPRRSVLQDELDKMMEEGSSSDDDSSDSSSSSSDGGGDDSFEATNKVRISLGLPPLHRQ